MHVHTLYVTHTHTHTAQGVKRQLLNYQPLLTALNTSGFSANDWIKALIKMHLTHNKLFLFIYHQKAK